MVVKGNQIEYVNNSFISIFGKMKNEIKKKNLNEVLPPEFLPVFNNLLQEGGKPKELKFNNREYSIYSFVIQKAKEEERKGIVFQDITEQKKAEDELKRKIEELERYKNVTVGRELTMIKLKKEINELCEKLGEKPKYNVCVNKDKL
jgi:PAS domain S-box-containing protein